MDCLSNDKGALLRGAAIETLTVPRGGWLIGFERSRVSATALHDEQAIARLLEEMRGLSHYFASYALNMREVDRLADRLYRCAQDVLLAQRASAK